MEKLRKMAKGVVGAVAGVAVTASAAMAEPTFTITPPDLDYVSLGTYAGVILGGLGAIWLIRKFIKITNRS